MLLRKLPNFWECNFKFVISRIKQESGIGGHIEIDDEKIIFIELDYDIIKFPSATAAALAHEIVHKYLDIKRIRCPNRYENGTLTDIATVYLGLGQIILNGYACDREIYDKNSKTRHNEILSIGYLTREQLALIYYIVCSMRKIPRDVIYNGLLKDVEQMVCNGELLYNEYFVDQEERSSKTLFAILAQDVHLKLFEIKRKLTFVQETLLETERLFVENHKQIAKLQLELDEIDIKETYNPCLRVLYRMRKKCILNKLKIKFDEIIMQTKDEAILKVYESVKRCYIAFSNTDLPQTLNCPNDGTSLKLPESRGKLLISCPRCKYQFTIDTTSSIMKSSDNSIRNTQTTMEGNLFSRLFKR
jgi:hypothetical protein